MAENVFKQARLKAAETNDRLKKVEGAAEALSVVSRERMYMIEQEDHRKRTADPTPYEVSEMAKLYGAPELCDYYCSHLCAIGKGRSPLMYNDLGEISARLMSSMHFVSKVSDNIHEILADSKVTEDEKAQFVQIIRTLRELSYSADSLELWAKKNGYI